MRILLIEDDRVIAESLDYILTRQHYVVDVAHDGPSGWELLSARDYNLLVLDVMLPGLDGISLCRKLRERGDRTPVLLLTAQGNSVHKVRGLDAGADDYVTKPFDLAELLARIRALLRRDGVTQLPILAWGDLQVDPNTRSVHFRGISLRLTPKEYNLLELFLRHPQRVFSRSAILNYIWAFDTSPHEDTVTAHIKGLRQKLKAAGVMVDPIETIYGIGYRLNQRPSPGENSGREGTSEFEYPSK